MIAAVARGEARDGDWLRADRQTGGHGRSGRVWQSPPGNLYASGIVRLTLDSPPPPTLALVAGLAVHDMVRAVIRSFQGNDSALRLKWPNDLIVDGAKLAGVLLQRQGDAVVVGVGINLAHHPDAIDRPATSIAAMTGQVAEPGDAMNLLAGAMAQRVAQWRGGLSGIIADWSARAHPLGTMLSADQGDGTRIDGAFAGLSAGGAMQLRLSDGTVREIAAGDVFLV